MSRYVWALAKLHQNMDIKTKKMTQDIVLTTGIYDLIKEHIRKKKVTPEEEEALTLQLKGAKQVTRKNLPLDVVTVDAKVKIKNMSTDQEETYTFVAPDKVKRKKNNESILSNVGLALVGCKVGDVVNWNFNSETKKMQILDVERVGE